MKRIQAPKSMLAVLLAIVLTAAVGLPVMAAEPPAGIEPLETAAEPPAADPALPAAAEPFAAEPPPPMAAAQPAALTVYSTEWTTNGNIQSGRLPESETFGSELFTFDVVFTEDLAAGTPRSLELEFSPLSSGGEVLPPGFPPGVKLQGSSNGLNAGNMKQVNCSFSLSIGANAVPGVYEFQVIASFTYDTNQPLDVTPRDSNGDPIPIELTITGYQVGAQQNKLVQGQGGVKVTFPATRYLPSGHTATNYAFTETLPAGLSIPEFNFGSGSDTGTVELDYDGTTPAGNYQLRFRDDSSPNLYSNFFILVISPAPSSTSPPTLSGPTALTLTEGYAATATGAYTVGGKPVPTVSAAGSGKISWNSSTNKLDIAAGLEAGVYPVTLTATNGAGADATHTFTLTVQGAPSIAGPSSLALAEGYAATATEAFTVGGEPRPTVTVEGNSKISWNAATGALDIAPGLEAGSYPVTLTATNSIGQDAQHTFTLTVGTAPSLSGPASMILTEGYAATATEAFTLGGKPAPAVTTGGNDKISWNAATGKLDIAAGLGIGSYEVTLTAANGFEPDARLTFTLTVVAKDAPPVPETGDPGWLPHEDGSWFYYDTQGNLVHGWAQIEGDWFFFGERAAMASDGWVWDGGAWYYMRNYVAMATGWVWDGGWYYMQDHGAMATGWLKDTQVDTGGDRWFFLNENGTMVTGWVLSGGSWYFMQPHGAMATGWALVNGSWYLLGESGAMRTGWAQAGGIWYFLNPDGAMATGWVQSNGAWYFLSDSGAMVTGEALVGGQANRFDENGVWLGVV